MSTSQMVKWIALKKRKKIYFSPCAGFCISAIRPIFKKLQKAFGSLIYEDTEDFNYSYCKVAEEESVIESVAE